MKILYVCHRFPYPPKRGGKIRPFNMIRHLTEQGHEVLIRVTPPSPVLPRGVVFFDEDGSSNYSCPTLEEELDTELPSRGAVLRRE